MWRWLTLKATETLGTIRGIPDRLRLQMHTLVLEAGHLGRNFALDVNLNLGLV